MRVISDLSAVFPAATALSSPRVLVPTMGALHAGHLALLKKARELAGEKGTVLVSIFVNPIQFGPQEDLAKYPRPRQQDLAICEEHGADLVFAPEAADMYADAPSVFVIEETLSAHLCGAARPGHFRGVCTVVAKLFHLLQPQMAVFGEKDYQQLAIIRRMVWDLNFPVEIVGLPTVRESDGLALSSRNRFLSPDEREKAVVISQCLSDARQRVRDEEMDSAKLIGLAEKCIEAAGGRIDYVEIVDGVTLEPCVRVREGCVMLVAAFFGLTRLIDNIRLKV